MYIFFEFELLYIAEAKGHLLDFVYTLRLAVFGFVFNVDMIRAGANQQ